MYPTPENGPIECGQVYIGPVRHVSKVRLIAKQEVTDHHGRKLSFGKDSIGCLHKKLTTLVHYSLALGILFGKIRPRMPQRRRFTKLLKNISGENKAFPHWRVQFGGIVRDVKYHGESLGSRQDHRDVVVVTEVDCHCFVIPVDKWVVPPDLEQAVLGESGFLDDPPRRFKPTSCLFVLVHGLSDESFERILNIGVGVRVNTQCN